jgi:catechol 2,3-dioxygenase-like lactoylglutathione lyase family enzyme
MPTQPVSTSARPNPHSIVACLNHVGHVVRDIDAAIALYRRMGFVVPPPSFPALVPRPGEPLRAFGAGNTHVSFRSGFVELVTVVDDRRGGVVGADATLVPLQAPVETLDRLTDSIVQTATRMSTALARFEGLHILVFGTADIDATIARLAAQGVVHSAVNRLKRPGETAAGATQISIGYVEIDSEPGLSPEGRLALVEDGPRDSPPLQAHPDHPNGAVELIESVLCVPDFHLTDYERRYSRYLQRPARSDGPIRIFDLDNSSVMIVPNSALEAVLPGEVPPALPAFVAYGVAVEHLSATRDVLERAEFPVLTSPTGGLYVPASAALGAAIIFRSAQEVSRPS